MVSASIDKSLVPIIKSTWFFDELTPNQKTETVDKLINSINENFGNDTIVIGVKKTKTEHKDIMQHKRPPEVFKR